MSKLLPSPGKLSGWLLIGLILIATWVRLWQFSNIPPAFNYGEAHNVIDTLWLRENSSFVAFLPGNTGRHALFHYYTGISLKPTHFIIRHSRPF